MSKVSKFTFMGALALIFMGTLALILFWNKSELAQSQTASTHKITTEAMPISLSTFTQKKLDFSEFSDEQICRNHATVETGAIEFYQERIRRDLKCDWEYFLARETLVPSPECIASLVENDILIPATDCLVEIQDIETIYTTFSPIGYPTPALEIEGDKQTIFASYSHHKFSDFKVPHWPIHIEINGGGTGWFSRLIILVQNKENEILGVYSEHKGDRCNDGEARWEIFEPKLDRAGYVLTGATLFRLLNPFDEINWRYVWMDWKFSSSEQAPDKESFLNQTEVPLFKDLLPYEDISNCALCCVGNVLTKENLVDDKNEVKAVLINMKALAEINDSSLHLDRCIANNIVNSAISSKSSVSVIDDIKLVPITEWVEIREDIAERCID